eukprot:TRINITY_DN4026_c0_g1_i2.p1 TRINITY_DN4026_c0_g1~~TRINITY_DN4026_c0_g1_i2.p1  ORF type:complete len:266 (+),score=38.41 TRINITY_DN4026_c0_g1_i2:102-899(+)
MVPLKDSIRDSIRVMREEKREIPKGIALVMYGGAVLKYAISMTSIAIQLFSVSQLTSCIVNGAASVIAQQSCSIVLPESSFYLLVFLSCASLYCIVFISSAVIVQMNLLASAARTVALGIFSLGSALIVSIVVVTIASMTQAIKFNCGYGQFTGYCDELFVNVILNASSSTPTMVDCQRQCNITFPLEVVLLSASTLLSHVFMIIDVSGYYLRNRTVGAQDSVRTGDSVKAVPLRDFAESDSDLSVTLIDKEDKKTSDLPQMRGM